VKPLFVSGVFVSNAGLARVKPGNGTRPGGNVREDVSYEDDDFWLFSTNLGVGRPGDTPRALK